MKGGENNSLLHLTPLADHTGNSAQRASGTSSSSTPPTQTSPEGREAQRSTVPPPGASEHLWGPATGRRASKSGRQCRRELWEVSVSQQKIMLTSLLLCLQGSDSHSLLIPKVFGTGNCWYSPRWLSFQREKATPWGEDRQHFTEDPPDETETERLGEKTREVVVLETHSAEHRRRGSSGHGPVGVLDVLPVKPTGPTKLTPILHQYLKLGTSLIRISLYVHIYFLRSKCGSARSSVCVYFLYKILTKIVTSQDLGASTMI